MSTHNQFIGTGKNSGFSVQALFTLLNDATTSAKTKIIAIKNNRSSISIGDMFEMQMLMNHLSQLSEMSSNVVSASNQAILTMARGVK
jgi:hypothetical protein